MDSEFDGAILKPQFALGITSSGNNGICHLDGERLLYPVGVHAAMYNRSNKEMRLMPTHEKVSNITCVTVSPNKKYLAMVEETHDSDVQQVSVYSLASDKVVKQLILDANMTDSRFIEYVSFSENSRLLLTQCGEPDFHMLIWRWFSTKVLITIRLDWAPVHSLFSHSDSVLLAAVGSHAVSLYKLDVEAETAKGLPLMVAGEGDGEFTSIAWVAGGLMAVTSTRGKIYLLQEAGVVAFLETTEDEELYTVTGFGRGLVAAGSKALFYIFEPPDADAKRNGATGMMVLTRTISAMCPGHSITCVSVAQGEDQVAGLLNNGEVVVVDMTALHEREEKSIDSMLGPLHDHNRGPVSSLFGGFSTSPIVGMDVINYPPVLVTVSLDRWVRVYNFTSWQIIAAKEMVNDASCCSLHPAGNRLLVGMADKLRMFSLAQHDMDETAEFVVKNCNLVRFSNGGHIFACVGRNNIIGIYHAFTHAQLGQLKAHVSAVSDIKFSKDDNMLVSIGAGGAVYFWNLSTYSRRSDMEFVDKRCMYTSAAFYNGYPGAIVRTRNGRIQHIQDGQVQFELECKGGMYAPAVLAADDAILLAANNKGCLVSYSWPNCYPVQDGAEAIITHKYRLHGCPRSIQDPEHQEQGNSRHRGDGISNIVMLPQKGLVFSSNSDGTLMVSKASLVIRGQLLEQGTDLTESLPVYITIQEERLINVESKLFELVGSLCAMKVDNEYTVFRKTQDLKDNVLRLEGELETTKSRLGDKGEELEKELAEGEQKQRDIIKELESAHMAAAEELENLYEKRLELERVRHKNLGAEKDDMQFRLEEQIRRVKEGQKFDLEEVHLGYKAKIDQLELRLKLVGEAKKEEEVLFDEYMQQAEVDFDTQTERMTNKIGDNARLYGEHENKLRADNNLLKRANLRLKGDKAIELKKMDKMMRENALLREALDDRETSIEKLRNELKERDAVMREGYQDMQIMRRKVQDLEKHKFVLSHKAAEYQAHLAPKVEALNKLASEVAAHDRELANELKRINELNRTIVEKDRIIRSLKGEASDQKQLEHHQNSKLRLFSYDVSQVYESSAERAPGSNARSPQQKGLEELYKKYCIEGVAPKSSDQVEEELNRHLHMAEMRTQLAKNGLEAQKMRGQREHTKGLDQNVQLLAEIQIIQQENKRLSRMVESTQAELLIMQSKLKMTKVLNSREASYADDQGGLEDGNSTQLNSAVNSPRTMARHSNRPMSAGGGSSHSRSGPTQGSTAQHAKKHGSTQRPTTASNANAPKQHSLRSSYPAATGGSSSPGGTNIRNPHYRNAGLAQGGTLARGAPGRAMNEVMGVEKEQVTEMMMQLKSANAELETQRVHVSAVRDTLQSQAAALGIDEEEDEELDMFPMGGEVHEDEERHAVYNPGDVAKALKRPGTAVPAKGYAEALTPTIFSSPPRRRPTSAAGVGMRAYVNGNLKAWREN